MRDYLDPGFIKVRCVRYALDSLPGIAQRIGGEDQETYYVFSGFQPTIAGRAKQHSARNFSQGEVLRYLHWRRSCLFQVAESIL